MLELKNICKDYYIDKKPFRALNNINLFFPKNQFCSILGPSGCGKTTTLNIIGGLDRYTSGDILINNKSTKLFTDKDWDNYRNKRIGFVFQNYNLISHLSILDNVILSLTLAGLNKKERIERAKKALDKVGLEGLYNKKPNQLSGGQMQRVAIARSLVNDPEIILADEPTGALDSKTSVQVMDILKEISQEKLVIMVTHNEKLAEQYSDRIITFKDGEVLSDSKDGEKEAKKEEERKVIEENNIGKLILIDEKNKEEKIKIKKNTKKEKTSMSFFTAVSLSLKNLRTKKTRTILTSVAASFGIIGVALVLAMQNGFTEYVGRVETQTAATLPITVKAYNVRYTSLDPSFYNQPTRYPKDEEIYPYVSMNNEKNMEITYNNFTEKYFRYLNKLRDEDKLINDYLINYPSNYRYHLSTEYPASLDNSNSGYIGLVSTSQNTGTINSAIGNVTGLPTQVFHQLHGQEKYILQTYDVIAGKYPEKNNELVLVVSNTNAINFSNLKNLGFYNNVDKEEDVSDASSSKKVKPISWNEILGKKYKVYCSDDYYDEISYNPKDEGVSESSTSKVYYKSNSTSALYNDATKGIECEIVGILRPSKNTTLATMSTGLCYLPSLQYELVAQNIEGKLAKNYMNLISFAKGKNKLNLYSELIQKFTNMSDNSITNNFINEVNAIVDNNLTFFSPYEKKIINTKTFLNYGLYEGLDLVPERLKKEGMKEKTLLLYLSDAFKSETDEEFFSYIVGLVAYMNNYSQIDNVIIFPRDLTSKEELLVAFDTYNEINPNDPYHAANKSEQIYYTDYVGALTDSLGEMINVISIVLVVFASISLVVSCVMTGIITYNSVIERTKEIGVLRAIGARTKDVGILFEAEASIIGFISGLIGCIFSYLVCFPINFILNRVFPEYNLSNIANLSIYHCLILITISILLTLISGFFPSRIAAKKDPVNALRSE